MREKRSRQKLATDEFEAVIRRATELSLRRTDRGDELLSEEDVVRIGTEVGLAREDVREALAEFRSGGADRPGALLSLLRTDVVRVARQVPMEPTSAAAAIDEFLVGAQLLHPVRRSLKRMQYRPAVDWMSKLARAASSTARQHYIAAAERVDVWIESDGGTGTFVELEVDPNVRSGYLAWVVSFAAAGGAAIGVGATILALEGVLIPAAAVGAGVALWAALTWAIARSAGKAHLRRLGEVQSEMEGILDLLESGEPLQASGPSWRRWIQRQLQGGPNRGSSRRRKITPGE